LGSSVCEYVYVCQCVLPNCRSMSAGAPQPSGYAFASKPSMAGSWLPQAAPMTNVYGSVPQFSGWAPMPY